MCEHCLRSVPRVWLVPGDVLDGTLRITDAPSGGVRLEVLVPAGVA